MITASADQLMEQASETADTYFRHAVADIDGKFGDGYAKDNPSLVAAFMQAATLDFCTAALIKSFQEAVIR